jgi:nitrate/nitrite transport system substrate-binding protein
MTDRDPLSGPRHTTGTCSCGAYHDAAELALLADSGATSQDAALANGIENALLTGLFPSAASRRRFLQAVGAATALSALESLLPVDALKLMAQEKPEPEKKAINVGFLPLTCATPLIMAEHLGLYSKHGLNATLVKTPGIAVIRDKLLNGELDVSEQVMNAPISVTMGLGSVADATPVLSTLNVHGNSLVLAMRHKDNRDPKNWKGLTFGVPFEHSQQAMLLRYYFAEHGLDPDQDVQLRVIPSSEYAAQLRAGNVDGFLGGEPGGQRIVYEGAGFIHALSKDLWPGHPCCALVAREAWIRQYPNTYLAVYRAVIESSVYVNDPKNRSGIAKVLAPAPYLNAPEIVIEQVISGRYADGLGNVHEVPDRILFDPFPYYSTAIWLMTQMKRWGYIKGDVDYKQIAERVMLATEAKKRLAELGLPAPDPYRKEIILGREFDPRKPTEYLASFPMKKT